MLDFLGMSEVCTQRHNCRICDNSNLQFIFDLGEMPPANAFLSEGELDKPEQKFPLRVYFCETCGLLQLLHVVHPKILFKNYKYLTSASKPLSEHFEKMAVELARRFIESPNDLVLEIGGNDGVLLQIIKDRVRVLNVEPAAEIARISRDKGVPAIADFFSKELAQEILKNYGPAKIVIANNVVAHIDDLKGLFAGVKTLISRDGIFVFEVHWVGNLVGEGGFDQIYHEHLSYFSLLALQELARRTALYIFDVELVPIHGECLRVYIAKNRAPEKSVEDFLNKERASGLHRQETYLGFADKVEKNKKELRQLLLDLKKQGKKIIGCGAPAKGNTLLNYFGIGRDILDFITDTTPFKQGTYSPGMHIPICHPDKLNEAKPDYILLLAWNYADAILEREEALRKEGVKFIIPVPEVKVV